MTINLEKLTTATLASIPTNWLKMEANFEITFSTVAGDTEVIDGLEVFEAGATTTTTTIQAYMFEPKDAREARQGEASTTRLQISGWLIDPLSLPTGLDFDTPLSARFLSGAIANKPGVFELQPIADTGSTAFLAKGGQRISGFFTLGTR